MQLGPQWIVDCCYLLRSHEQNQWNSETNMITSLPESERTDLTLKWNLEFSDISVYVKICSLNKRWLKLESWVKAWFCNRSAAAINLSHKGSVPLRLGNNVSTATWLTSMHWNIYVSTLILDQHVWGRDKVSSIEWNGMRQLSQMTN